MILLIVCIHKNKQNYDVYNEKTIILSLSLFAFLGTSVPGIAASPEGNAIECPAPPTAPANAVAQVLPNGGYQIYTNRLKTTFEDGLPMNTGLVITDFSIGMHGGNYYLSRKGANANASRHQVIALQITGTHLLLAPWNWSNECRTEKPDDCGTLSGGVYTGTFCRYLPAMNDCHCQDDDCKLVPGFMIHISDLIHF